MAAMLPVPEARARIIAAMKPLPVEEVTLVDALGRVLAEDVSARLTQPPADMSAMDGYAVRMVDIPNSGIRLKVIGQAPAGGAYSGVVRQGEAVRIFTGGPVPEGADTIVIQEDTERDGDSVIIREVPKRGRHIRQAGVDFHEGANGLSAGRKLSPSDIGFAAAMNVSRLKVHRRPRIAFLASGDELVEAGTIPGPNQIISSNGPALAAIIAGAGCEPVDLGIVPDDIDALRDTARRARGNDMLVTIGGASVGDHDLVQKALEAEGLELDFWRIAMRPGKPLMFGTFGGMPLLGLPGNPVSAIVCATLFLLPALARLQGETPLPFTLLARLGAPLSSNGEREHYQRAKLDHVAGELPVVTAFADQDSSLLSVMSAADCLIVQPVNSRALDAGEIVSVVPLRY